MFERTRAPKGGIKIDGIFYKGGQFLPSDNIPKRGKFNSKAKKSTTRKIQIGFNEWMEYPKSEIPEMMKTYVPIYTFVAGSVAKPDWNNDKTKLVYCGNPKILAYRGITEETAKWLIKAYNNGSSFALRSQIK